MSHEAFFRTELFTSVYYPLAQLLASFSHTRVSMVLSGVELVDDFYATKHVRIYQRNIIINKAEDLMLKIHSIVLTLVVLCLIKIE
jgi:hypothetical protein